MALNGSGVMQIDSTGQPVVATTLITAAVFNAFATDVATAISTCLMKDGQQTVTANVPFNNKKITGLAAATARTDAASIATIQDGTGVYVATVGGTADAITLTPSPAITAYVAGQTFQFIASGANTTAVTVAVSGLASPKAITKNGTTALVAGDIPSAAMVTITYDGTRFILGTLGAATHLTGVDSVFRVVGSADATKKVAFEVDGLTTGTTRTVTVPDRDITIGPTLATEQVTTSGTSIDFTGIPVNVNRITVMFVGVSTNTSSTPIIVQIGDSGGIETTNYNGQSVAFATSTLSASAYPGAGFVVIDGSLTSLVVGTLTLNLENGSNNMWVANGFMNGTSVLNSVLTAGSKSLSAVLDRVRITTPAGTATFDAGAINISYE